MHHFEPSSTASKCEGLIWGSEADREIGFQTVTWFIEQYYQSRGQVQDLVDVYEFIATTVEEADRIAAIKPNANGSVGKPIAPVEDDSAYVPRTQLSDWQKQFESDKQLKGFLDQHPEIRQKRMPRRHKVHAGDWARYWALQGNKAFGNLDNGEMPEITAYMSDEIESTKSRYAQIHNAKQCQGPKGKPPLDKLVKRIARK